MGAILVVQEEGTSATWEIADRSGGELAPGGTPQARVNLTGLYCLGCGNRCDVFEFDDALEAYDKIMTTKAAGKVTIKVDPTVSSE